MVVQFFTDGKSNFVKLHLSPLAFDAQVDGQLVPRSQFGCNQTMPEPKLGTMAERSSVIV
jgi:hypothetical protein